MNKIIYFDKETIQNILQEQNQGSLTKKTDSSTNSQVAGELNISAKIKLGVPFMERLQFLFSGKIATNFIIEKKDTTTISSTEISEFRTIKDKLVEKSNIKVSDVENSSTFFRATSGYLRIIKGGVDGVDIKEFKAVMEGFDGYDTYEIDKNNYVRFNNKAFVSNYKRNDILTTKMNLFCIPVGTFNKDDFNFQKVIEKMQDKISYSTSIKTLAEMYPNKDTPKKVKKDVQVNSRKSEIALFDVVYACISVEDKDA